MSHSYSKNYVHVIYSTKDRQNLIPPESRNGSIRSLHPSHASMKSRFWLREECPTTHLLFLLPATISLASAINTFKTNSSRFMHERGLALEWQNGYGAFSVGLSQLDKVTAYVRSQPEHHKKMTFEEEFLALLKKADVPYDPKYVFG